MELKQNFHSSGGEMRAAAKTGDGPSRQFSLPGTEAQKHGSVWGFAQILEHVDVGVLVLDLQRQAIDYRNPVFDQLLQETPLGAEYQALYQLLLCDLEEAGRFEHASHILHQVTYQNRLFGCSVYRIAERYRCIFLRDITEKARLESIAQAVNAMDNIGFIFSGIRHEIGNPLNSLKMALSVMKKNIASFTPEQLGDYIDRGLADIGRMEYLLKSLKTFSLYEHVDLKDMSLSDFMEKFLSLIERDFASHGIEIELVSPLSDARVRVDKRALHQSLLNVFNNAAEALAGQDHACIKIDTERRGPLIWLRISDNGCGIFPEQQEHLFQPFNTNKPNGNGLGLVITRKLLAMMNSDIEIDSEPRNGTRVTISLPVSPDEPPVAAEGR